MTKEDFGVTQHGAMLRSVGYGNGGMQLACFVGVVGGEGRCALWRW